MCSLMLNPLATVSISLKSFRSNVRSFRLFDQEVDSRQNYSFFRVKLGAKQRDHVREAN